jgi:endonuclease/exonuclease/phosphatase family metal-dependent hydrolase
VLRRSGIAAVIVGALAACGDDRGASLSEGTGAADSTAAGSTTQASTSDSGGVDTSSTGTGTTGAPVFPLGPWRVMAFNIMCETCTPEGFEPWDLRVPHIGDTVRRHDPDLLGTQELFNAFEVAEIEAEIPGYTSIWFAKPTPDDLDYADAAIWYRTGMFEEVEHGFYWLSPKPDMPYSTGFAAPQLPRLVVWARLLAVAEGHEFVFATTHFDNNAPSQEMSAPLVLERTAALGAELPVVMVGDYNSDPADLAYEILTQGVDGAGPRFDDAFVLAPDWRQDTNLDPVPSYDPAARIDHFFVTGAPWTAADWVVDQWGYGPDMMYTSDHFALSVELAIPGGE